MKNLFVLVATLTLIAPTISYTMLSRRFFFQFFLLKTKEPQSYKHTPPSIAMTKRNDDSEKDNKSSHQQSKITKPQAFTTPKDSESREKEAEES